MSSTRASAMLGGLVLLCCAACEPGWLQPVQCPVGGPVSRLCPGTAPGADRAPITPWGVFTGAAELPGCPRTWPELVVDSADDQLDGGPGIADPASAGARLSLAEALVIARNRPGGDTILFAADVFPPEAAAVIVLRQAHDVSEPGRVCIDGRDRGVVVQWAGDAMDAPQAIWALRDGSLQVGLTLLNPPAAQDVEVAQVAGCRIGTDGDATFRSGRALMVDLGDDARLGPANVIASLDFGVGIDDGIQGAAVTQSFLGYDPLTERLLELPCAVVALASAVIEGNLIAAGEAAVSAAGDLGGGELVLRNNRLGVDPTGALLPRPTAGLGDLAGSGAVRAERNLVRNADLAVLILEQARVRLSQNSISGNRRGIVYLDASPEAPPAPAITAISARRIDGTCPAPGAVEVFSDPGDQGERYLGTIDCEADSPWSIAAQVASGRNVTATLTGADGRTSPFSQPLTAP